jgi:hypothetical protein
MKDMAKFFDYISNLTLCISLMLSKKNHYRREKLKEKILKEVNKLQYQKIGIGV